MLFVFNDYFVIEKMLVEFGQCIQKDVQLLRGLFVKDIVYIICNISFVIYTTYERSFQDLFYRDLL